MRLRLFSAADIRQALPMPECVEVMKRAFADYSTGRANVPLRTNLPVDQEGSCLLIKPAFIPDLGLGAKLVSVFPGNPSRGLSMTPGLVVLMSPKTGEPQALIDGGALTAWRTGAASGAATDLLANPNATTAAVFGAGEQARTQLLAIYAVRDLTHVQIYCRTSTRTADFISEMQPQIAAQLVAAATPQEAIENAEIVCAATTSKVPVFLGEHLRPGTHVNGVGSFTPQMQEVDIETVSRARVFVDSLESAKAEPGDLLEAIKAEVSRPSEWTELGAALDAGSGRKTAEEITLFKSVGLAVQDIAAGAAILKTGRELGLGKTIDF